MTLRRATGLACTLLVLGLARAAMADPFAAYLGTFQGDAQVVVEQGEAAQTLRCRVVGAQGDRAQTLDLAIKCATLQTARSLRLTLAYSSDGDITSFTITSPPQAVREKASLQQRGAAFTLFTEEIGSVTFAPGGDGITLSLDAPERSPAEVHLRGVTSP